MINPFQADLLSPFPPVSYRVTGVNITKEFSDSPVVVNGKPARLKPHFIIFEFELLNPHIAS